MKTLVAVVLFFAVALKAPGQVPGGEAGAEPSSVVVKAALDDGLYDLAARQCGQMLKSVRPGDPGHGDLVVLMAQALHGQKRYAEMLSALGPDASVWKTAEAGAAVYWEAVAHYELGQWSQALKSLEGFSSRFRDSPYKVKARRLEAWCRLKAGEAEAALDLFARIDREYGQMPEGRENLLEWGQALLGQGNDSAARSIFERLVAGEAASAEVQEGKLWLAQAMIRGGQWDKAWNLLNLVASDKGVRADRRARAWLALSEVNASQTNMAAAAKCAAEAVALAPTDWLRNRGYALQGRWLIKAGKLDEGAALLRKAITAEPASGSMVESLQLELAGAYLGGGRDEQAAVEYQYYLESYAGGGGRIVAYRGRGAALWNLRRYAEAAAMYEKAASLETEPVRRGECHMKSADALFENAQYRLAHDTYGKALQEAPSAEWTPQGLLQQGECLARQKVWDKAEEVWRSLVGRYPGSPMAERALLRIAETREERGPSAMRDALLAYSELLNVYPQGEFHAEALYRRGLVAYQLLQFGDALKDFTRVSSQFTNSPVAPQALFMGGQSLYMMGREEEAVQVCRSFLNLYPKAEWAPRVMSWMGEYAFNRGNYAEAETIFAGLAEGFPKDKAVDRAWLWAGLAAMKQKEYLRAASRFADLAEKYPDSPIMDEVRFQQGDLLSELGEFSRAIVVFDDLIRKYPASKRISAAWGRRGDCQFTLGATDPRRYEEAMESYSAVTRNSEASFDLRLQAEYKMGRCLEKLGRKEKAFDQYYARVMIPYLERESKDRGRVAGAAIWFTSAGFAAADILEGERDWKRAVRILERVVGASVPAAADARARIERIRAEHWIW